MRLMVGSLEGRNAVFLIDGDAATNLTALDERIGTDLTALAAGRVAGGEIVSLVQGAPAIPVARITPRLPVERPGKIICLGLNYVDHVKEGGYDIPDYPAIFMRSTTSIMPAGAAMVRPACSDRLDYEVELMVVIGRGGRHIARDQALGHVFGYTVFNDGSVRDYQRKTHQWTPGKNFDATGAVGAIVVTPDELPEGARGLKIESRVGSEILQSADTADMMWSVEEAIAIISEYTTLEPGDLIAMGTPPGVGHARTPPRWLVTGETVEVEIERIGICASPIVDEPAR
ncbi:fumarylacetoacetate hydrolase family protein [Sphingomonas sp.]|uniref:fumarylacetoacetate hydrolase family protein n=1 Tax=Sphingomonas sp. TaxID=28214 RepID=UPI002ED78E99